MARPSVRPMDGKASQSRDHHRGAKKVAALLGNSNCGHRTSRGHGHQRCLRVKLRNQNGHAKSDESNYGI